MAGSLHEATRSRPQAHTVLGGQLVGLLLTQLPRPLVPAGDQGSKAGLWPSYFGLNSHFRPISLCCLELGRRAS